MISGRFGYVPERGDAVWLYLSPREGEIRGSKSPALVLSTSAYNAKIGMALICPITEEVKGYPFEVPIPVRMEISGAVLSDEMRTMDWRMLKAELICRLPASTVSEVLKKASTLLAR